jgi:hypothetical protein
MVAQVQQEDEMADEIGTAWTRFAVYVGWLSVVALAALGGSVIRRFATSRSATARTRRQR